MEEQNQERAVVRLAAEVTCRAYRSFYWRWLWRCRKGYTIAMAVLLLLFAAMFCLALFLKMESAYTLLVYFPALVGILRYRRQRCETSQAQTAYTFYETHLVLCRRVGGMLQYYDIPYDSCAAFETKSAFCVHPLIKKAPGYMRREDDYDPDPHGAAAVLDLRALSAEQIELLRELFHIERTAP